MSLNSRGRIHQGHERVILVMPLEEEICVWMLYYVSNICRFANGATVPRYRSSPSSWLSFFAHCIQQ